MSAKRKASRYRRYQKSKNPKIVWLAAVAAVVVIVAAVLLVVLLGKGGSQNGGSSDASQMGPQLTSTATSGVSQESSASQASSQTGPIALLPSSSSSASSTSSKTPVVTEYQDYVKGKPVPQSPPVDTSYFKDAVFVGNSRTEGLMMYTGLGTKTTAFADKGLTVKTVFSKELVKKGDKKVTVSEALKTTDYKKCYIMLGINELGWPHEDVYITNYEKIIDEVKSSHPDAIIYVQSILPVSASKSAKNQNGINNERINLYNKLLQQLADEKGVYYLDSAASVKGSDGTLPEAATSDGIHLDKKFCEQWLDYLKNHTVKG